MARRSAWTARELQMMMGACMRSAKQVYGSGPHADVDGQYDWRPAWTSVVRALAEDEDGFSVSKDTLQRYWRNRDPELDEGLRVAAGLQDIKSQSDGGQLWVQQVRGFLKQRLVELFSDEGRFAEARVDQAARAVQLGLEVVDRLVGEEDLSGLTEDEREQRALLQAVLGD